VRLRLSLIVSALLFALEGCAATRTTYVDPYGPAQPVGMHWSAYEVFSVISGVILIAGSLLPRIRVRDRFWAVACGAGLIAYAIYTGHQISGTYTFPVVIFIIPFVAVIWLLARAFGKRSGS
jgi:uncharacterized membrane protein (DUF2068 family)